MGAMTSKRVFQAVFAAISTYSAYRFAAAVGALAGGGSFPPGAAVRLRVLGLRGGGPPAAALLATAGLLRDGCRVLDGAGEAPAPVLGFEGAAALGEAPAGANGYFFVTAGGGDGSADPVRWVVESTPNNGSTWLPVGASVWRLASDGTADLFPELAYDTPRPPPPPVQALPVGGGAEVLVDVRPPNSWVLSSATEKLAFALGLGSLVLAGLLGRAGNARALWVGLLLTDLVLNLASVCVVVTGEPWLWREAAKCGLYVVGLAGLAAGALWLERHFIAVFLAYSAAIITGESFSEIALYGREWRRALLGQMASLSVVAGAFAFSAFFFRRRARVRARLMVLADRRRYDALWETVRAGPAAESAVLAIRTEVLLLCSGGPTDATPRQRIPLAGGWRSASSSMALRGGAAVGSLDQLFVQAMCLSPVLISKVQAWALASGGCFPCARVGGSGGSFVRWADAARDSGIPIRWASVKSHHRAIEKIVRVYAQVRHLRRVLSRRATPCCGAPCGGSATALPCLNSCWALSFHVECFAPHHSLELVLQTLALHGALQTILISFKYLDNLHSM
jgi:hypothetical protein